MSSSKSTKGQKYQNVTAFKNDKYGATPQVKKANSKVHEGLCQRCKDVLEWKVKYNKYKFLTQPRKCVKCLQKTVKDAYHIMCRPCAEKLELCAKCGKKEEIIIPLGRKEGEEEEEEEHDNKPSLHNRRKRRGKTDKEDEEQEEEEELEELDSDCGEDD